MENGQTYIPLWVAILTGTFALASPFVGYYFARSKNKAETAGLVADNQKKSLENFDFGIDALDQAKTLITQGFQKELKLEATIRDKDREIEGLRITNSNLEGRIQQVQGDRDKILDRVRELERQGEKTGIQMQTLTLTVKHLSDVLRQHQIEVDLNELNNTKSN